MEQFSHDLKLALQETSKCSGVSRWSTRRRTRSTGNLREYKLVEDELSSFYTLDSHLYCRHSSKLSNELIRGTIQITKATNRHTILGWLESYCHHCYLTKMSLHLSWSKYWLEISNPACAPQPTEDSSSPADAYNAIDGGVNPTFSDSDDRQEHKISLKSRQASIFGNLESDSLNENFSPAR